MCRCIFPEPLGLVVTNLKSLHISTLAFSQYDKNYPDWLCALGSPGINSSRATYVAACDVDDDIY